MQRICFQIAVATSFLSITACAGRAPITPVPNDLAQFQRVDVDGVSSAGSATHVYTLGDGGPNASVVSDMRIGADGKLYYATDAQSLATLAGEVGSFNLTTHTQTFQTVSFAPSEVEETSNGSVWVVEFNNASGQPTVDRYSGIGGADTPVPIPVGPFNGINGMAGGIAVGADGQLWFGVGNYGNGGGDVGEINQATNGVTLYPLTTPSGGTQPTADLMVLGPDKHIWVTDGSNDGVDRVASSGVSKGASTYAQLPQGPVAPPNYPIAAGISPASDKHMYVGVFAAGSTEQGGFDRAPVTSSPSFVSLPVPSLGISSSAVAAGNGKVYFAEVHFGGLGIYDIARATLVVLPTTPRGTGLGVIVDSSGIPWLSCTTAAKVACIERIALTSTWNVYPSSAIKLYTKDQNGNPLPPGLIGIGESGNSGPFTVTSSNAKVCTANVLSGFGHNIEVSPVAPGKCTVSITDAHSRTVKVTATVINGKGSPQVRDGRILPASVHYSS